MSKARGKTMTQPMIGKEILREEEVSDGINVIIDNRFVAMFPMECRAQVEHLIESVNLAFKQRLLRSSR
jgi:hypothetical protein